jgi:hypothetical protein
MSIKSIYKKYFESWMLALAVIFFLLAGFSFLSGNKATKTAPKQTKQTLSAKKVPTVTTPVSEIPTVEQKIQFPTPTLAVTIMYIANTDTPQPTNTPVPQQIKTNEPVETIKIEINKPDGNSSFTLTYHDGKNPCSILNDAKTEGKIQSVTITHYGAPLNSDYVKEINGYQDHWTFAVNGETKPTGCSNYTLTKGNIVTWKYN